MIKFKDMIKAFISTVRSKSLTPFYLVTYYINGSKLPDKTYTLYSMIQAFLYLLQFIFWSVAPKFAV